MLRAIDRSQLDDTRSLSNPAFVERVAGIEGTSSRLTAEAEWKRSFTTDGGLVVTPLLAFQADTTHVNESSDSIAAINSMASNPDIGVLADIRSAYNRFLATAGLELRFPVLFSSTSATHVLEPMAQIFARNDPAYQSTLGIPNEDAQSFVFDATTLFERDKFSGYDRIEGGTRANVGFRYSGAFANGWTANGLVGQSYQSRRRKLLRDTGSGQCRRLFGAGDRYVRFRRPVRLCDARPACPLLSAPGWTSRPWKCGAAN